VSNPRKRPDQSYRTFFELVGGNISTAVADARTYQEERKRAEALAEIGRAKTAFFSNISYGFRTPLTLILGPLKAMLERVRSSAAVGREELQLADRNGMRLLKLVNALLEAARVLPHRSRFQSAMERAGLEFVIDCPPLPEPAYVDREMWEKIILNLVSNAFFSIPQ